MRVKVRFWLVLGVLLTAGVVMVRLKQGAEKAVVAVAQPKEIRTPAPGPVLMTTPSVLAAHLGKVLPEEAQTNRAKYQLSNVPDSIEVLAKRDSSVLMRNALIDTKADLNLAIPAHLRSGANPGSYIVQYEGVRAGAFQKMLKEAGAEVVAYVPNNAYLVKAGAAVASGLQGREGVSAVLPYEPYYKIDTRLMKFAVDQEALEADRWLRVTLFPGADWQALQPLAKEIGTKEESPFGDQLLVNPRVEALASLAQLAEVQLIEPWNPRVKANDLTRVRLGIAEDTITEKNYLDLTGSNVWVNINDIGVDRTHQDLAGKVFYHGTNAMIDPDGHGTHVAATIAGFPGTNEVFDAKYFETNAYRLTTNEVQLDDTNIVTVTVDGSLTNASMRGMAPLAKLFALPIDFVSDVSTPVTDSYLIETAARTNYVTLGRRETLISNNSWNYANTPEYDSQAARFDAATRDAIVEQSGSQPVMYVFAAGNYGFGANNGLEGEAGRIASPGTAKNVLTIGALETPRFMVEALTNLVVETEGTNTTTNTNVVQIFLPATDSDNQVASFSSRGNVGILSEGPYGRFKPDLVAPGTFIFSARSKDWNLTNDFNPKASESLSNIFNVMERNDAISTKYRYDSGTSFSAPGVSGMLALVQEFFSSKLPTSLQRNLSPALMKAMLINSARSVSPLYDYQVQNVINYQGWGLVNLQTMLTTNMLTAPENQWHMRMVDQSTTNALASGDAVSWTITLDTNAVLTGLRFTLVWTDPPGNPSVATKLVNDLDLVVEFGGFLYHGNDILQGSTTTEPRDLARPFDRRYSVYQDHSFSDYVNNVENVNLGGVGAVGNTNVTVHVIGRRVNVKAINDVLSTTGSRDEIKQDFALVISSDYRGTETNAAATPIPPFTGFTFNGLTGFDARSVTSMTNGVPLLNQHVGANAPLGSVGQNRDQWNFYVFTNNNANVNGLNTAEPGEYVAFVTFTPPNLSIARTLEADIDMYVSKNPQLTNLVPAVLTAPTTYRSVSRLGTEQVIFQPTLDIFDESGNVVDSAPAYDPAHPEKGGVVEGVAKLNDVFYIAIKSEDQQAAEYSFMTVSSSQPFQEERNGKTILTVAPVSAFIPDGSPNFPAAAIGVALGVTDTRILDATVALSVSHEEFGDLLGALRHNNTSAILNNHSLNNGNFTGTNTYIFSDDTYLNRNTAPDINSYPVDLFGNLTAQNYRFSEGPGTLMGYGGTRLSGSWIFEMVDNALTHTGRVERMEVQITPIERQLPFGETITDTVNPLGRNFYLLDVPPNASRLIITLRQNDNLGQPLELIVGRDTVPSTNTAAGGSYDYYKVIAPPAQSVTITIDATTFPPLVAGEYFVGVLNPWPVATRFDLTAVLELDSDGNLVNAGQVNIPLVDDARKYSTVRINDDKVVTGASVAIVTENGLVSDYAFRLTSPQGKTIVLSENRGGLNPNGFGSLAVTTNSQGDIFTGPSYAVFTDNPVARLPIKFTPPPFGNSSTNRGPLQGNGFEGATQGDYAATTTFDGWNLIRNSVTVVTRPDAHSGDNFLSLRQGTISRTIPTIKDRSYKLSFAYRAPSANPVFNTGQAEDHSMQPQRALELHYQMSTNSDLTAAGTDLFIGASNLPPVVGWLANTTNSQWTTMMPENDNNHPAGGYAFKTSFVLNDPGVSVVVRYAAATSGRTGLRLNNDTRTVGGVGPNALSVPISFPAASTKVGLNTLEIWADKETGSGPIGLRTLITLGSLPPSPGPVFGKMRLISGISTNEFVVTGGSTWQTFETDFIADEDNLKLEFASSQLPGLELDSIVLIDTGTVFMQPEEPLVFLEGERAMGEWKLEAWDNRTGLSSVIRDWQLILSTATAVLPAEAMNNFQLFPTVINTPAVRTATYFTPGVVKRGETHMFYYDICPNARNLAIQVIPSATLSTNNQALPLEVMVDRTGFPTGNPELDDYSSMLAVSSTPAVLILRTNEPAAAPLRPGTRIFIGVRNLDVFTTNSFRVMVISDGLCVFTPPLPLRSNETLDYWAPSRELTEEGSSFSFAASGESSVEFNTDGAGDLVAVASANGDPSLTNFDVRKEISSTTGTLNLPGAGNWRIRVFNQSNSNVRYSLTARGDAGFQILESQVGSDGVFRMTWQSEAGTDYEVLGSINLTDWDPITTVSADGTTASYSEPVNREQTNRFYQVRVKAPAE